MRAAEKSYLIFSSSPLIFDGDSLPNYFTGEKLSKNIDTLSQLGTRGQCTPSQKRPDPPSRGGDATWQTRLTAMTVAVELMGLHRLLRRQFVPRPNNALRLARTFS
ncbi:hypothetical protein CEXT_449251 [Caerostris extrusa]|uniref:Uncharacterized protein n=1 Tax=Caerostris extrusa TaxID=172846 RepID=A0AAV4SYY4_CAEEX|nr:hypothetical protein CEXT_449251 [Caerostris extrusa]